MGNSIGASINVDTHVGVAFINRAVLNNGTGKLGTIDLLACAEGEL